MNIYVISLKDSIGRRENATRQMQAAGLSFEFFDALNGREGHEKFFSGYDERAYLINTGRTATAGEIGCYASHLALWKKCVELNQAIMIMEDDFYLNEHFAEAVHETEKLIAEYGFIRLQTERRGKKTRIRDAGRFSLYYYSKMPHSLMCYAISPRVAQAFIERSGVLREPVDVLVKKIWQHKQRLYGLAPYTVGEGPHSASTTIRGRVKAKRGLGIRLLRVLTKAGWMVKNFMFNLRRAR